MFNHGDVRFVSPFSKKKPNFQNDQKSHENKTNMDITLSFLAKPVDKHGITDSSALAMQSRYRDDEDGGRQRILESQPKYS